MSFTLEEGLSPRPDIVELADFWEIECLKKADFSASLLDISKSLGISEDVQESDIEEEETELEEKQQHVVDEIERRIKSGSGKYPFKLSDLGYVLSINVGVREEWRWMYTYLLLATRNNMNANKIAGDIDGTQVFEKLSKDILLNYLGEHSKGIVFGTAIAGGFRAKLKVLATDLKDGVLRQHNELIDYNPQDDKLDIAAWIQFKDDLPSKLICFAQCKTGTHWHHAIHQLEPNDFLKKWFSMHPRLDPIRTFFIADVLAHGEFFARAGNNLFLDRIRITSLFTLNNDNDWYPNLKTWTQAILDKYKLFLVAA